MQKRTFQIYRYDPDKDAKPYMQTIEVELDGHRAHAAGRLIKLKNKDPTLSFRRSCREGVCGSDAMNINGKNGLACLTNMNTLKGTIVLKPLPGLPVIRDLIVDMTQFFKQYNSIKPYLINDNAAARARAPAVARRARRAQRPVRVHPVRQLLDQLPQLLVEPRQVRRPGRSAAGLPLHRRQPRQATGERLDNLEDPYRLFRCHTIMNCVDVCPKGLNPTKAIGKIFGQ
jgi:succinate dehydrogenase / fumarate reductase iron-sulfur subunit